MSTSQTPQTTGPAPDTSVNDVNDLIGSGQEGSVADQARAYLQRIQHGSLGDGIVDVELDFFAAPSERPQVTR